MAKTLVQELAEWKAEMESRIAAVEKQPRLSNASIDDETVRLKEGERVKGLLGRQPDGSHGSRVVESPPQPVPSAPGLIVGKAGVVTVRWDGEADAPVPLVHGHIEVQIAYDGTTWEAVSTIRDRAGGATSFVADVAGTVSVRLVMVGQDRITRGEPSEVSTVEVELPVDVGDIEAKIEAFSDGELEDAAYDNLMARLGEFLVVNAGQVNANDIVTNSALVAELEAHGITLASEANNRRFEVSGEGWQLTNPTTGDVLASLGINGDLMLRSVDGTGRMSEMSGAGFRTEAADGTVIFDSRGSTGESSTAFGVGAVASAGHTTAIGEHATASGDNSTAIGQYATASENSASALGTWAEAEGNRSTALGSFAKAPSLGSTALGDTSNAMAERATALGATSGATGTESTAVGTQAQAKADQSTAVGWASYATGEAATAVGWRARGDGDNSIALGKKAMAEGVAATALGRGTSAPHDRSTALGAGAETTASNEGVLGGSDIDTTHTWRVPGDFSVEGTVGGAGLIREIGAPVVDNYGHTESGTTAYIIMGKIAVVNLDITGVGIDSGNQNTLVARLHSDLAPPSESPWSGASGAYVGIISGRLESNGDAYVHWSANSVSGGRVAATLIYPVA